MQLPKLISPPRPDDFQWDLPETLDWATTHPENLQTILDEAKDKIRETESYFRILQQRSFTYISILTPVAALSIGLLISEIKGQQGLSALPDHLFYLVVAIAIVATTCLLLLSLTLFPKLFTTTGIPPVEIVDPTTLYGPEGEEDPYAEIRENPALQRIAFLRGLVARAQNVISFNQVVIFRFQRSLKLVLVAITGTFAIATLLLVASAVL